MAEPEEILQETRVGLDIDGVKDDVEAPELATVGGMDASGQPSSNAIACPVQRQEQSQWCWAAVAASVSQYYDPAGEWTQCQLANVELGQQTCCLNGATRACNRPWRLDSALQRTDNLNRMTSNVSTLTEIHGEIDSSRPLALRIGWQGGGGHFVIVIGYSAGTDPLLSIEDPLRGRRDITYSTLQTAYEGAGTWTHSYYTRG